MKTYFPIFVMVILATGIGATMIILSAIFSRRTKSLKKFTPYECGVDPVGSARERFPIKYYMVAMLFIIFDIETVFLYPWAVVYKQLGWFGFIEMGIFILLLFLGYVYVLKKGALRWD